MRPKKGKALQLPLQKEGELLTACKQILRILAGEGLLAWRRIHVMPVLRSMGGGSMRMTLNHDMAGMPDLMIWVKCPVKDGGEPLPGPHLCVELKSKSGKLSELQLAFGKEIASMGHAYYVVRSVEELCQLLYQSGVNHWILSSYNKPQ